MGRIEKSESHRESLHQQTTRQNLHLHLCQRHGKFHLCIQSRHHLQGESKSHPIQHRGLHSKGRPSNNYSHNSTPISLDEASAPHILQVDEKEIMW